MINKKIVRRVLAPKNLAPGTLKIPNQLLLSISLASSASLAISLSTSPAEAIDPADDAGVFGSITVTRQAREGMKALDNHEYSRAVTAYNAAIGLKADVPEFYYGLLYAGQKAEAWEQVDRALTAIAEQDPAAKKHLFFEYGNCYTKLGRYDEAVPMLKAALVPSTGDENFVGEKVKKLIAMTKAPAPPVVLSPEEIKRRKEREEEAARANQPPPPRPTIDPDEQNLYTTMAASDYLNAFLQSEWIGICEYKGFDKKEYILFSNPPIAHYHVIECLKGPPLNPELPLRYTFKQYDGEPKPNGWKFSPESMPKKGSRWLIFIQTAVPREGAFDTYKGRYGRQEATEDNLGRILEIKESHHGQQ